jgi:hypothetical protein
MAAVHDLAIILNTICTNVFETIGKIIQDFKGVYEKIVEIIEAFENEDQPQNKRLPITAVVSCCLLSRDLPREPRRIGRRMGGWGWNQ